MIDWYEREGELQPGMVFKDFEGDTVRLYKRVPGDGTKWYVELYSGNSWGYWGDTLEPGDLRGEPLD